MGMCRSLRRLPLLLLAPPPPPPLPPAACRLQRPPPHQLPPPSTCAQAGGSGEDAAARLQEALQLLAELPQREGQAIMVRRCAVRPPALP